MNDIIEVMRDRPPIPAGSALRARIYAALCVADRTVGDLAEVLGSPLEAVRAEVLRLEGRGQVVRVARSGRRWRAV